MILKHEFLVQLIIAALILISGAVFLILGLKGKKIKNIILAALLVLISVILAGSVVGKYASMRRFINENNYISYRLIEEGNIKRSRLVAGQANEIKYNEVSEQLILIGYCFEGEYDIALEKAAKAKYQNQIVKDLIEYCEDAKEGLAYRSDLIDILEDIADQIKLSNKQEERAELIISAYSLDGYLDYSDLKDMDDELSESDDANSLKARIHIAYMLGDMVKAEELSVKLVEKDDSFSNKAMLANIVATGQGRGVDDDSEKIDKIKDEIRQKEKSRNKLEEKMYEETDEDMIAYLQSQIEAREKEIADLYHEISSIPVKRALNYIIATASQFGNEPAAYKLQLARLYYLLGEEELAEENLQKAIKQSMSSDEMEYLSTEIYSVAKTFEQEFNSNELYKTYDRIDELLTALTQNVNYSQYDLGPDGKTFGQFIIDVLNNMHTKIYISHVDTTQYPTVDVYINMTDSKGGKKGIDKNSISVVEMGENISEFEFLQSEQSQLNICLVVDTSGSMEGMNLSDAQRAIQSFIQGVDRGVRIGLVTFESSARTVSEVTQSTGAIAKAVDALYADGGTHIASGLIEGMNALENKEGKKIIILLSDGEDGSESIEQMPSVLQTLKKKGISVYSIGFSSADLSYLEDISGATGGKAFFAFESDALGTIYNLVKQYIENNYILRFKVTADTEELNRTVTVNLEDGSYSTKDYTVGVPLEDIEKENEKVPMSNFYQQIGGSSKGGTY